MAPIRDVKYRPQNWLIVSPQMLGCCVYIWKKSNPDDADTVMYVGSSMNGVRRFAGHHVLPFKFLDEDYIELIPCSSRWEARDLERRLIRELHPKHNKQCAAPMDEREPPRDITRIPYPLPKKVVKPRFYFSNVFKDHS